MTGTKGALLSAGIWGSIVAILPQLDQILTILHVLPTGFLSATVASIASIAGSILAIWGRAKATTEIKGLV